MAGHQHPVRQALCCECGQLREFKIARNHREENYWLNRPVDADWHRETGDLKCEACEKVTTHALLHPDGDWAVDHAEKLRLIATGWSVPGVGQIAHVRAQIQRRWREGLPRNPYARHLWWASDEEEARAAGHTHFQAICRAEIEVPSLTRQQRQENGAPSYKRDELVAPGRFHDVDREDPETGLWWFDLDCTDCLRRANAIAVDEQREALKEKLLEIAGKVSSLDAVTISSILSQFAAAEDAEA